jgi:hypothetical protein
VKATVKKKAAARARVSPLFSKYLKIVSFFLRGERRRRRVEKQKKNQTKSRSQRLKGIQVCV